MVRVMDKIRKRKNIGRVAVIRSLLGEYLSKTLNDMKKLAMWQSGGQNFSRGNTKCKCQRQEWGFLFIEQKEGQGDWKAWSG